MNDWEDYTGHGFSREESELLRFQHEHKLQLDAARLGVDMDHFVHRDPAGVALIQLAIDHVQANTMLLLEVDLKSDQAAKYQREARAGQLIVNWVRQILEGGGEAAAEVAEEENRINATLEDDPHA